MDFNQICHDTPENLKLSLTEYLSDPARSNDIQLTYSLVADRFRELILSLFNKTGQTVVIPIDEYDKPIVDNLGKGNKAPDDYTSRDYGNRSKKRFPTMRQHAKVRNQTEAHRRIYGKRGNQGTGCGLQRGTRIRRTSNRG